ncbi:hypothetical protein PAXRUDRAFT_35633 [Paxillus rubicundulus Ve08.2h10]|uniref:Protein kinase domain-containing protein n=1 Tax=Paxillus rubicundulus Ve08.2h10 TaxID=930991 RepID=A0A0D0DKH8_9AGAM|nr:hypothetical protein PAXRUDRAFT_35633 [Paxillus rubicundulus Ve08.2h10]
MAVTWVDGRFQLIEKVEYGSYATVYHAQNIITNEQVTVKRLQGGSGVPQSIWFGREGPYHAMVLKCLGPSLSDFNQSCGTFGLQSVSELGIHLIYLLKFIHTHNVIHHNIKPQNMLMGLGDFKDTTFIIDFGVATEYCDASTRIHVTMHENRSLIGTPTFTSINSHMRLDLSRCDDIEALAYTLIFMLCSSLPWLTFDGQSPLHSIILECKKDLLAGVHDIPPIFAAIVTHAHSLSFLDKPNYDYLCSILEGCTHMVELHHHQLAKTNK